MGLDISYYSNIKEIDCVYDRYGEPIDQQTREPIWDYYQPISNPHFQRQDDIDCDKVYTYESRVNFRAGSYGGYNQWRSDLEKLAGYATSASDCDSGAFWELIVFSDCEGTIGASTSAKLAKDFEEFQEKADQHDDKYFRDLYKEWRLAFETASKNGAVSFH